jgi:hypothetical protein
MVDNWGRLLGMSSLKEGEVWQYTWFSVIAVVIYHFLFIRDMSESPVASGRS